MEDYERTLRILEDSYEDYAAEAADAIDIARTRITNVKRMIERSDKRSPFDSIHSRVKSFDSTIEKCKRKGYDINIESIKHNVLDVAGIRIITPFRDDIETVVDILHHIPGINIQDEKDYVKNPKPNGYSSYHMHIFVEVYSPITNGTKLIPIEIQIRCKSMDLWASVEHIVKYKNDAPDPRVEERFKSIADLLAEFDEMAILLRDFDPANNEHEA